MPIYTFENPETGEQKDVVLGIHDDKIHVANGIKWNRVFSVPNAAVDTKIDPLSSKEFAAKTRNKTGSVGDLFDQSRELSDKRVQKCGNDPVKNQYYENWSARRKRDHPDIRKQKAKEIAGKAGIDLTD